MRLLDLDLVGGGSARTLSGACTSFDLAVGDITRELTDAIVNPVGGLIDISVQEAAGPLLLDDFHRSVGARCGARLAPGQAVRTPGYGLAAPYVIHCGQPVYADGPVRARATLAGCHIESLRLAREANLRSVSFPAIGTGLYRFPLDEAATIAMRTVIAQVRVHGGPPVVRFVLPDETTLAAYRCAMLAQLASDLAS